MKKSIFIMLVIFSLGISLLAGCGEGAKASQPEVSTVPSVTEELSLVAEETTEPEEAAEQLEVKEPKEWITSLELTAVTPFIWNEYTGEGILISEGESYVMTEQQTLYIYSPKQVDSFTINEDKVSLKSEIWLGIYLFSIETGKSLDLVIKASIGEDVYTNQFKITREGFKGEEINNNDLSVIEWLATFEKQGIQCPTFIAWNDETNTKTIIENGGEYLLQKGDKLGLYTDNEYSIIDSTIQENINVISDVFYEEVIFDQTILQENQELKFVVANISTLEQTEMSITILRPTE